MKCTPCCEKNLMNKTWLAVKVLYFKFIGQIPCNSHEYYTCDTSRSMGRGGRSGCPWWFSSTVKLRTKVILQGHNLGMKKGAAGAKVKEQVGSVTDAGSCTAMTHWCPCCSLKQGPRSQENNLVCTSLLNFSPISITLDQSMESSLPAANRACRADLLISLWFLHPTWMEIHTASLAWLSCPLDTDLSQWAQRSAQPYSPLPLKK